MNNLIERLQQQLAQGDVLVVQFTKKNGEERVMRCTRNQALIPAEPVNEDAGSTTGKTRKQPEGVEVVWDLEKGGWRSFQHESVISVSVVED